MSSAAQPAPATTEAPKGWAVVLEKYTQLDEGWKGWRGTKRRIKSWAATLWVCLLGLVLVLVCVTLIVALVKGEFQASSFFGLAQGLSLVGAGIAYAWAYRARALKPGAAAVIKLDTRQPVLLLRPFKMDDPDDKLEQNLAEALRHVGPLVAIGRPGESVPPDGATRLYLRPDGDGWQETVSGLAACARFVIVRAGRNAGRGTQWEVDHVVKSCDPSRVIVIVPRRAKQWRWSYRLGYKVFRREMKRVLPVELPEESDGAVFFAFGPDWSLKVLGSREYDGEVSAVEMADLLVARLLEVAPDEAQEPYFREAAEAGDARAAFALGQVLERTGRADEAWNWFVRAQELGSADVYNYFGELKTTGDPRVGSQAYEWFSAAAKAGHGPAARNLGEMYLKGYGVVMDLGEAFKWLELAAKAHDARAMKLLADMYSKGLGAEQSLDKAAKWREKAALAE